MADSIKPNLQDVPVIPGRFRLQWEPAQNSHVLLYPEGMVQLSDTAAEILKRINGTASVLIIVEELERSFPGAALRADVMEFLEVAQERGWITFERR
jgi:pyrroloquinoline quinone biosynthesis protein D